MQRSTNKEEEKKPTRFLFLFLFCIYFF